jgi:lipopolysaccharide biosynthesis glycosyltransferase
MTAPIAIACGISGDYALPLAVTIRSLLASTCPGRRITFYILDGGIPAADRKRLESTASGDGVSLVWLQPQKDRVQDLPTTRGMSLSTYYRLLLGEALPSSLTKVIWLDSDLLVIRDIGALDALDPSTHPVLAAQDMVIPFVSCPLGVHDWRALGLAQDQPHFNAGVMVLNLDLWRAEQIGQRVLDYLRTHCSTIALHDQEALNAVLAGRWSALDQRWNQIASVAGRRFQKTGPVSGDDAWIFHFAGDWKPWTLPHGRHPYDLFYRCLDETPWAGWRPGSSVARSSRAFYHEHLRDFFYPLESALTNLRYGRLFSGHR